MLNRRLRALTIFCPYCGAQADFKTGDHIWGNRYEHVMVYICSNYPSCNTYGGVHRGTNKPFGTMANANLRHWRKAAHRAFDPLWKDGRMKRTTAYRKLSMALKLDSKEVHIGMFDIDQCKATIRVCEELLKLHSPSESIQLESEGH